MIAPLRLVRALHGRSVRELRERGVQAAHAALERAGLSADLGTPSLAVALDELRDKHDRPFASVEVAHAALVGPRAHLLVPGLADRAATLAAVEAAEPEARARCLAAAERLAAGRFDLLGYTGLEWGTPIDWQLDPVSARRAPRAHWSRVPYLEYAAIGDHKVTWEVNRHQWLVTLAQAWWFTADERWAELALAHLDHWIDENPVKTGVNWSSSLEIAFRSMAWTWTLHLLRGSRSLTPERHVRILGVLARSVRHIERYLSTWFSPNTHLTGEALAILTVGCAYPQLRDAERFRRVGREILEEWIPRHVRADGSYVEQSTWYARYTADFLVHAIVIGEAAGTTVAPARAALDRLATFLLHLMRPDGSYPLIGDDDGGRLLFLDGRAASDLRPTLATAAALLGRSDLAWGAGPARSEPAWLLGATGAAALERAHGATPACTSMAFPDGGLFALRDGWDREASVGVIDCGPHAFLNGGHAHADLLSLDLTLRGRAVVRDPGTYTYTASPIARNAFRSAELHATLSVDGQGSAVPAGPFSWASAPKLQRARVGITPLVDVLIGTHDGFARLPGGVTHERAIVRAGRDYWAILDRVEASGPHLVTARLPLAPGLTTSLATGEVRDGRVAVAHVRGAGAGGVWRLEAGWQSLAYGHRVPSEVLVWETRTEGAAHLAVVVSADGAPAVALTRVGEGAFTVGGDEWVDLLVLCGDAPVRNGGVEVTASFAWIRRTVASRRLIAATLLDATRFEVDGQLLFESTRAVPVASASSDAAPSGDGWTPAAVTLFRSMTMVTS